MDIKRVSWFKSFLFVMLLEQLLLKLLILTFWEGSSHSVLTIIEQLPRAILDKELSLLSLILIKLVRRATIWLVYIDASNARGRLLDEAR